jgi:hypothetical protein
MDFLLQEMSNDVTWFTVCVEGGVSLQNRQQYGVNDQLKFTSPVVYRSSTVYKKTYYL